MKSRETIHKQLGRAIEAYRNVVPVVVMAEDGSLLHGAETLQLIKDTGINLTCLFISDIRPDQFHESHWPARLEAARLTFVQVLARK